MKKRILYFLLLICLSISAQKKKLDTIVIIHFTDEISKTDTIIVKTGENPEIIKKKTDSLNLIFQKSIKKKVVKPNPYIDTFLKQNIVFVYFENLENLNNKIDYGKTQWYEYYYNDKNTSKVDTFNPITLIYEEFVDFDAKARNDKALNFQINQSFLIKNKNIIIDNKILNQIGKNDFLQILTQGKKIFLIDKSETTNNMIRLKEVELFYMFDE